MAFWTCSQDASSSEHIHDFDEYMIVVQGCYTVIINGERIFVRPGEEYLIPQGVPHSGEVKAGTRTIHVFGGHRADRVPRHQSPRQDSTPDVPRQVEFRYGT